MKKKSIFIVIIAVFSAFTFWNLYSKSSRNAKADVAAPALTVTTTGSHLLDISMTPDAANMQMGEQKTIKIRLSPRSTADYIRALYILIRADYGLQILDVSAPMDQNGTTIRSNSQYSYSSFSYDSAQIVYEFTTYPYPTTVDFNVMVRKSDSYNSCALKVDSISSGAYYGTDYGTVLYYYYNPFDGGNLGSFRCLD